MKLYCPECQSTYDVPEGDEAWTLCPNDGARLFKLQEETKDPLLGAIIDERFEIERKLGQGGMGAVYIGKQLSVGRSVAIKVLRNELVGREIALERFYRESKIISDLTHPNIVRLIDFGQDAERDMLYLVMELVDGQNMGDMLERGRMRVAMALELVYQVCGALTEPHKLGVVHRDLKPDNLLIVPISDGTIQVKVLDFGIARALETNTQLTATGMVCGTPQYMAPEQAQNKPIQAATDLYALGVILYEMLAGIPPFQGQNSLQVMIQQIQKAHAPLTRILPPGALPREVEQLVDSMLAKEAADRPDSALAVRKRIDQIRRTYNLEPVHIDPELPRERMFRAWMLPKLPGVFGGGLHIDTEMLRRETPFEPPERPLSATGQDIAFVATVDSDEISTEDGTSGPPAKTNSTQSLERIVDDEEQEDAHPRDASYSSPRPSPGGSRVALLGLMAAVALGIFAAIVAIGFLAVGADDEVADTSAPPEVTAGAAAPERSEPITTSHVSPKAPTPKLRPKDNSVENAAGKPAQASRIKETRRKPKAVPPAPKSKTPKKEPKGAREEEIVDHLLKPKEPRAGFGAQQQPGGAPGSNLEDQLKRGAQKTKKGIEGLFETKDAKKARERVNDFLN
ncbi:MAG: protein kinase [Myxococcota bacterium]